MADPVVPYVYQEFPRRLHGPGGTSLIVPDDAAKAAALEDGRELLPMVEAEPLVTEDPVVPKRGPGRPRRA